MPLDRKKFFGVLLAILIYIVSERHYPEIKEFLVKTFSAADGNPFSHWTGAVALVVIGYLLHWFFKLMVDGSDRERQE